MTESLDTLAKEVQYHRAEERSGHFFLGCSDPREHVHTKLGSHMYHKPLSFEHDGFGTVKMLVFEDPYNHDEVYMFRLEADQIRKAVNQKQPIDLTEKMAIHRGREAVRELNSPVDLISQLL